MNNNFTYRDLTDEELDEIIRSAFAEVRERKERKAHKDWEEVVKVLDTFFAKGYDYITLDIEGANQEWGITPNADYKTYAGVIIVKEED